MNLTTAKSVGAEKARVLASLMELERDREQINFESTEARLERNRLAVVAAQEELHLINRAEGELVHAKGPAPEDARTVEAIRELQRTENRVMGEAMNNRGVIPSKFIRSDAVEFFGAEVEAAKNRIAGLHTRYGGRADIGPRIREEIKEQEEIVELWNRENKRLATAGARVHGLRQEREQLSTQLAELRQAHNAKALAVA